jgi:hypothetical protein
VAFYVLIKSAFVGKGVLNLNVQKYSPDHFVSIEEELPTITYSKPGAPVHPRKKSVALYWQRLRPVRAKLYVTNVTSLRTPWVSLSTLIVINAVHSLRLRV